MLSLARSVLPECVSRAICCVPKPVDYTRKNDVFTQCDRVLAPAQALVECAWKEYNALTKSGISVPEPAANCAEISGEMVKSAAQFERERKRAINNIIACSLICYLIQNDCYRRIATFHTVNIDIRKFCSCSSIPSPFIEDCDETLLSEISGLWVHREEFRGVWRFYIRQKSDRD